MRGGRLANLRAGETISLFCSLAASGLPAVTPLHGAEGVHQVLETFRFLVGAYLWTM